MIPRNPEKCFCLVSHLLDVAGVEPHLSVKGIDSGSCLPYAHDAKRRNALRDSGGIITIASGLYMWLATAGNAMGRWLASHRIDLLHFAHALACVRQWLKSRAIALAAELALLLTATTRFIAQNYVVPDTQQRSGIAHARYTGGDARLPLDSGNLECH